MSDEGITCKDYWIGICFLIVLKKLVADVSHWGKPVFENGTPDTHSFKISIIYYRIKLVSGGYYENILY